MRNTTCLLVLEQYQLFYSLQTICILQSLIMKTFNYTSIKCVFKNCQGHLIGHTIPACLSIYLNATILVISGNEEQEPATQN